MFAHMASFNLKQLGEIAWLSHFVMRRWLQSCEVSSPLPELLKQCWDTENPKLHRPFLFVPGTQLFTSFRPMPPGLPLNLSGFTAVAMDLHPLEKNPGLGRGVSMGPERTSGKPGTQPCGSHLPAEDLRLPALS